jgi:solute carrier family 25, member 39/40
MSAATRVDFDNISRSSSTVDSGGTSAGGSVAMSPDSGLGLGERALSAAGAAFISAIIVNPLDVAKVSHYSLAFGFVHQMASSGCHFLK